jgi:EF-hand domain pair
MLKFLMGALLAGCTSLALAQPPAPPAFDELDADGSGALSPEEVEGMFARFAGRGAENGNGPGGRPPGRGPDPATIFGRWDTNGDGAVSREEFDARPRFGRGGPPGGDPGPGAERPPRDAPRRIL